MHAEVIPLRWSRSRPRWPPHPHPHPRPPPLGTRSAARWTPTGRPDTPIFTGHAVGLAEPQRTASSPGQSSEVEAGWDRADEVAESPTRAAGHRSRTARASTRLPARPRWRHQAHDGRRPATPKPSGRASPRTRRACRAAARAATLPPPRAHGSRPRMNEYDGRTASQQADERNLDWLVTRFVDEVSDAAHAILVSADGLLMAASASIPRERAEQLGAVSSGLASLARRCGPPLRRRRRPADRRRDGARLPDADERRRRLLPRGAHPGVRGHRPGRLRDGPARRARRADRAGPGPRRGSGSLTCESPWYPLTPPAADGDERAGPLRPSLHDHGRSHPSHGRPPDGGHPAPPAGR